MSLNDAIEYARRSHDRYLSELKEFIRIPTISTLTENRSEVERGAEWLSKQFETAGLRQVEVIPTDDHPLVYGERLEAPNERTVLPLIRLKSNMGKPACNAMMLAKENLFP